MSRLDEALRHAGVSSSPSTLDQERQNETFHSPWKVSEDVQRAVPAPPAPAAAPAPTAASAARPDSRGTASRLTVTRLPHGLDSRWKEWLVSPEVVDPAIVEQFRRLAATIFHAQRDGRLKVIMVASAVPGEGKTLTALNLALVLAQSYKRSVLLVDADLRRPRLSEAAGFNVSQGLADALKSADERKVTVTELTDHLTLLPAGRPDPEPLSALTSPRMQQLLDEASERFDWVIVDTPPVAAATDAGLLGAMVDGTVLVVRAGHTPYSAVRHAVDTFGRDHIVGVVLNGLPHRDVATMYGNYSGYQKPDAR